jgi:hypothetical protein
MRVTRSELPRKTRKAVRSTIQGKKKTPSTQSGHPCAEILPFAERRVVSEDELRSSVISDEAILAAVSEARE